MTLKQLVKSNTVRGAAVFALFYLLEPTTLADLTTAFTLPAWIPVIGKTAGGLLAVVGLRRAVEKSGFTGGV